MTYLILQFLNILKNINNISFNKTASDKAAFQLSLLFNTVVAFVFNFAGSKSVLLINFLSTYLITKIEKNYVKIKINKLPVVESSKDIDQEVFELEEINDALMSINNISSLTPVNTLIPVSNVTSNSNSKEQINQEVPTFNEELSELTKATEEINSLLSVVKNLKSIATGIDKEELVKAEQDALLAINSIKASSLTNKITEDTLIFPRIVRRTTSKGKGFAKNGG